MFATDYGAVVSIELPVENVQIAEYINNKQFQDKSTDFHKQKLD